MRTFHATLRIATTMARISRKPSGLSFVLLIGFVLFLLSSQPSHAATPGLEQTAGGYRVTYLNPNASLLPAAAKNAVSAALHQWSGQPPLDNTFKVIALRWETQWALLTLTPVSRTIPGEYLSVGLEDRFSILAVNTAAGWQAALEWSPDVRPLLAHIPLSALPEDVRQALFSGKIRTFDVNAQPPAIPPATPVPANTIQSGYDPNAANAWAGANNYNNGQFYGTSQGRYCTTYIGRAWSAGGLSGASTSWIGNGQIVQWMEAHTNMWTFEDRSSLVTGDIILFSSDPNYNDWTYLYPNGASRFGHSAFVNNQGRLSAWNAEYWDKPNTWYDNYGLPYHLGVHILGQQPPGSPTVISPTNGQTLFSDTFTVSLQPGATNYTGVSDFNLIVADNSSFTNPVFNNSSAWSQSPNIQVTVTHDGTWYLEVRQGDRVSMASAWVNVTFTVQTAFSVGQNAGTWNNQTSAFWQAQFQLAYNIMNRPSAVVSDASAGSQLTQAGDGLIANPAANRVFWAGSGIINILKANNYPFNRVIGQSEAWGSLGLIGPPTTDETWMGGTVWELCFTNGCLHDDYGTATSYFWPNVDPTQWRIDMFNDDNAAGGYSNVINSGMADNGFFVNGSGSPDPKLLPTDYQMHFWKEIGFAAGTYQFQAETLVPGEWVLIQVDLNLNGNWTTLLDTRGQPNGQIIYASATLPAGIHRIFIYYGHTTGSTYGMAVYWQDMTPIDSIGIFRSGTFYLRLHNSTGNADISATFNPATHPYPVVGDWIGQGFDTVGIFDQSNALFSLRNTNTAGTADEQLVLGNPNDMPLAGRWSVGTTLSGVGVFRPSNGLIYLKNTLTTGYADATMVLGIPGDVGLAGDWTGKGYDSPGVYRPSNTNFYLSNQVCSCSVYADLQLTYGVPGDAPVVGDWLGQGHDGVGLFRQSNGYTYLRNTLTTGYADITFVYGIAGDIPVAGHWQLTYPPAPNADAKNGVPTLPVPPGSAPGSGPGD